jgi:hypothetical protein
LLVALVSLSGSPVAPRRFGLEQAMRKHIGEAFKRALVDKHARVTLKAQLTMLCDEGRSHPEYWQLKGWLDRIDGGEDDGDVLSADGSFDESFVGDTTGASYEDLHMGSSFHFNDNWDNFDDGMDN